MRLPVRSHKELRTGLMLELNKRELCLRFIRGDEGGADRGASMVAPNSSQGEVFDLGFDPLPVKCQCLGDGGEAHLPP